MCIRDRSITIKVGTGELTFNNNDIGSGRAGFFEAAEVSNIIIVHFQGTVDEMCIRDSPYRGWLSRRKRAWAGIY